MENKEKPKSKAPKIFGLLMAILILLYLAMVIPGLPGYRAKGFCSQVESDANNIAAIISDYFAAPENRDKVPAQIDIEKLVDVKNPWKLTKCCENFYIHVIDSTKKCPAEYQKADPGWNANIYTLKF